MKIKIVTILVFSIIVFGSFNVFGLDSQIKKDYNNFEKSSQIFEKTIETKSDLPDKFDWRDALLYQRATNVYGIPGNGEGYNFMTRAKSQGSCSSCWAFGTIGALEGLYKIMYRDPFKTADFSEQYMVSCADWGYGCFGCTGSFKWNDESNFLSWLRDNEAIPEECFSYTSGDDGEVPPCDDKCSDWTDKRIFVNDYHWIADNDRYTIKDKLIHMGPLVAFMDVYEDFHSDYPDSSKWPDDVYFQTSDTWIGPHIVVIVGYNEEDPNNKYWICKNSWGRYWADYGYFKIKYGECKIETDVAYIEIKDIVRNADLHTYSSDELIWEDITPGDQVNGEFTVFNFGQDGSYLDWEITDYPDWGSWEFEPPSGNDLDTDTDIKIDFSVTLPLTDNKEYTGKIKIENKNNIFDTEYIDISISTSVLPRDSDLECFDIHLNWNSLQNPGSQIQGRFKVRNGGDTHSELDWEITEYSEELEISPMSGNNLKTSDDPVNVDVTIDVPDKKLATYIGAIRVENKNNEDDYKVLPITFQTPKPYFMTNLFTNFLLKIFDRIDEFFIY